jgi:hypothetical protein
LDQQLINIQYLRSRTNVVCVVVPLLLKLLWGARMNGFKFKLKYIYLHEGECSSRGWQSLNWSRNSPPFMETEVAVLCSLGLILNQLNHIGTLFFFLILILPFQVFFCIFRLVICPFPLIILDLINLIIFSEEHNLHYVYSLFLLLIYLSHVVSHSIAFSPSICFLHLQRDIRFHANIKQRIKLCFYIF